VYAGVQEVFNRDVHDDNGSVFRRASESRETLDNWIVLFLLIKKNFAPIFRNSEMNRQLNRKSPLSARKR
jgi:hypothetical protein